jgi:hypothetical protein
MMMRELVWGGENRDPSKSCSHLNWPFQHGGWFRKLEPPFSFLLPPSPKSKKKESEESIQQDKSKTGFAIDLIKTCIKLVGDEFVLISHRVQVEDPRVFVDR